MRYSVRLTKHAYEDIRESVSWYGEESGTTVSFLTAVNKKLVFIAQRPRSYPIKYNHKQIAVRSAPLSKFPFVVLYFLDDVPQHLVVLAVWHTAQDPLQWKKRL